MNNKRTHLLGHAPVGRAIFTLAVPAMLAMFMNAVYNLVDAVFIGQLHDTDALAAISLIFPVFMVVGAIGLGFGIGGASAVSRFLGEKKFERAEKIASTAFFLSLISGVIFATAGQGVASSFLKAMKADGKVYDYSLDYIRIILIGGGFQIMNMTMNNMIRAEGAAIYSGIAISSGAILNIILDPIFIFWLDMGVKGAAVATTIGQFIAFLIAFSFFFSKHSAVGIKISRFSRNSADYGEIFKIGIPTFARQLLTAVAMFIMMGLITPYGGKALAAVGVILRLIMFASFVVFGYAQAFQPVCGYNYGASSFGRMYKSLRISLISTAIYSCFMTAVMMIFPGGLISLFSKDTEVIEMGSKALRIFAISFPFLGFQVVYGTFFQAIGYGMASFLTAIARQGVFLIPLLYLLEHKFELTGIVVSQPAADYLTLLLTIVLAVLVHRKLKLKENEASIERNSDLSAGI